MARGRVHIFLLALFQEPMRRGVDCSVGKFDAASIAQCFHIR